MIDLIFYNKLNTYFINNIEHLSPSFIDCYNAKRLLNIHTELEEPNDDFVKYFYTYLMYFNLPLQSIKYVNNTIYNSKNIRV